MSLEGATCVVSWFLGGGRAVQGRAVAAKPRVLNAGLEKFAHP